MKNKFLLLIFLALITSCAKNDDNKDKILKSDDFKNKMSDKIAKKIPNYPKFGDVSKKFWLKILLI